MIDAVRLKQQQVVKAVADAFKPQGDSSGSDSVHGIERIVASAMEEVLKLFKEAGDDRSEAQPEAARLSAERGADPSQQRNRSRSPLRGSG
eukprot:15193148-Alexandrium_andersonii.AAC.1